MIPLTQPATSGEAIFVLLVYLVGLLVVLLLAAVLGDLVATYAAYRRRPRRRLGDKGQNRGLE